MSNDNGEVSLGQLCELVQAINARLIESQQALDARLTRLENGAGPSGAAPSGVATSGFAPTAPESNYAMPDRILAKWTSIIPDEVATRFEEA